jgi:hypothetical protein
LTAFVVAPSYWLKGTNTYWLHSSLLITRYAVGAGIVGFNKIKPYDRTIIDRNMQKSTCNGRMARGGHGLPKFSPRSATPYLSTLCGRATLGTALRLFQGWLACSADSFRPSSTPPDTTSRTPMHNRMCITPKHVHCSAKEEEYTTNVNYLVR